MTYQLRWKREEEIPLSFGLAEGGKKDRKFVLSRRGKRGGGGGQCKRTCRERTPVSDVGEDWNASKEGQTSVQGNFPTRQRKKWRLEEQTTKSPRKKKGSRAGGGKMEKTALCEEKREKGLQGPKKESSPWVGDTRKKKGCS